VAALDRGSQSIGVVSRDLNQIFSRGS